jgi:hypothetical protein
VLGANQLSLMATPCTCLEGLRCLCGGVCLMEPSSTLCFSVCPVLDNTPPPLLHMQADELISTYVMAQNIWADIAQANVVSQGARPICQPC